MDRVCSWPGRGASARRSLVLGLTLVASLAGPGPTAPAAAAERKPVERRTPALDLLKKKHPSAGFRLDPMESVEAPAARLAAQASGAAAAPAAAVGDYDRERLLAGHLLRRISFGPTPAELTRVLKMGRVRYIDWQLNPARIKDAAAMKKLPKAPRSIWDDYTRQRRWYARMLYSQRQLQERMTLIWHEHFATSNEKVGTGLLMQKQEDTLRRHSLGDFRDFLIAITQDQAMLYWLDNDYNSGTERDDAGELIPPNANYAREFLQLFTLGPQLLNMDGTPITDANGVALPSYTEQDVKQVARALTGWYTDWPKYVKAKFDPWAHDSDPKTILGTTIPGRQGVDGMNEVADVVDIVMQHQNLAPFISKILIQKLALEQPSPEYVFRVASVFAASAGDIRQTVRAILTDPEFESDAALRTQYKEPIEFFIGPLRALGGTTKGGHIVDWTYLTRQLVYYPPSVFSFYPPGQKRQLVNTALVTYRDRGADELVTGWWDTSFNAAALIKKNRLTTPEQTVDWLADALLVGPLSSEVRDQAVAYMDGRVDDVKFKGAAWLILVSPDFQRN